MIDFEGLIEKLSGNAFSTSRFKREADEIRIAHLVNPKRLNFPELFKCAVNSCTSDCDSVKTVASAVGLSYLMLEQQSATGRKYGQKLMLWLATEGVPAAEIHVAKARLDKTAFMSVTPYEVAQTFRTLSDRCDVDKDLRAEAMHCLGLCYERGFGVVANVERACRLHMDAAVLGHPSAALCAGLYFDQALSSSTVSSDAQKAGYFYEVGRRSGSAECQTNLGILHVRQALENSSPQYGMRLLRASRAEGNQAAIDFLRQAHAPCQIRTAELIGATTDWCIPQNCLVRQYPDISSLAWAFCQNYPSATVASAPRPARDAVMCMPATIAHWIAGNSALLRKQKPLRIAIIGSGEAEARSAFEAIPLLLGLPTLNLHIDFVGPDAQTPALPCLNAGTSSYSYSVHEKTVSAFLSGIEVPNLDLAVVFHPGMADFSMEWFDSGNGLSQLVAMEVPVLLTSFSNDDQAIDAEICEINGIVCGEPQGNSYSVGGDSSLGFAVKICDSTWMFCGLKQVEPLQKRQRTVEDIAAICDLMCDYAEIDASIGVTNSDVDSVGMLAFHEFQDGRAHDFYHLIRSFVVRDDGKVFRHMSGKISGMARLTIPSKVMRKRPSATERWFTRAQWVYSAWDMYIHTELFKDHASYLHALTCGDAHISPQQLAVLLGEPMESEVCCKAFDMLCAR